MKPVYLNYFKWQIFIKLRYLLLNFLPENFKSPLFSLSFGDIYLRSSMFSIFSINHANPPKYDEFPRIYSSKFETFIPS